MLASTTLGAADGRRWRPARCAAAPDTSDTVVGDNVERAENSKQIVEKRRPRRNVRVDWCDAEEGEFRNGDQIKIILNFPVKRVPVML